MRRFAIANICHSIIICRGGLMPIHGAGIPGNTPVTRCSGSLPPTLGCSPDGRPAGELVEAGDYVVVAVVEPLGLSARIRQ